MTDATIHSNVRSPRPAAFGIPLIVAALWLGTALTLAAAGAFSRPDGELPLVLLGAVLAPPLCFLFAYRASGDVRRWVHALDPGLVVALQSWRVLGGMFLALAYFGLLPYAFAVPAGVGDVLVGLGAPFVALSVWRRSAGWRGRSVALAAAGLIDFVAALATGLLSRPGGPLDIAGQVPSTLMGELPMTVVPSFFVPAFIIAHLIALLQLRAAPH